MPEVQSSKIKGEKIKLELGSPASDYWMDCKSAGLNNEEGDSDAFTFYEASTGGNLLHLLEFTALQSTDPDSLCMLCWDNVGETVPYTYAPHGNTTPTEAQPHFVGTGKIVTTPPISAEAGAVTDFEGRIELTAKPTKVIAPDSP